VRLHQGQLDEAQQLHEQSLAVREELRETSTIAESRSALARLKLERDEPAAAQLDAGLAIDAFAAEGRDAERGLATALLAQALSDQGRAPDPRRTLAEAQELGGASQQLAIRWRIRLIEARVAAASGQTRAASELLEALEREAEQARFALLRLEARPHRLLVANDRAALVELQSEAAAADAGWIRARAEAALSR
jgi:hypothetical protein